MEPAWIAILISSSALILSIIALIQSLKAKKYDLYLALLKQYDSPEMLNALRSLWNFIEDCDKNPDKIIKEYVKRYEKSNDQLHSLRRVVKVFYEHLAFLYFHDLIPRKFKRSLPGIDLRIIEFLHPIEERAIRKALKKRGVTEKDPLSIPKESEESKLMYRLYNVWIDSHKKSKGETVQRPTRIRKLKAP